MPEYQVITAAAAEQRFSISRRVMYPFHSFADQQEIRLYTGPVRIDGDFTTAPGADWNPYNVIVDGDLTVTGNIKWQDYGAGCFLVVTGDVRASNLIAHGCPNIFIGGSLDVDHGVQGHHGDDGGLLFVTGEVTAQVVVNTLYFTMELRGEVHAPVIGDPYRTSRPVDFDDEEADEVLIADALEPEGGIDEAKVTALLEDGRRILRPGVKPAHVVVAERLARLRESPDDVTELDLSSTRLRAVPAALSEFPNLRRLVLSHNPIRDLPRTIGDLVALEELHLESTEIEALPPEIGKLSRLRVLDVSASALDELPPEIGQLSALRVLKLARLECPLPAALGQLRDLEELDVSHHRAEEQPLAFPQVICELSGLRVLTLTGTAVRELPAALTDLGHLHTLELSGALGALESLPDLSRMRSLKTLRLSGNRVLIYVPFPKHSLLDAVWGIESLEHLSLDRWGAQSDYNAETGEHEQVRGDLDPLPDGIGRLVNLKTLDLSFNGLVSLPDALFGLEKLEEVDLRYNPLSRETLDRLGAELPDVTFDLRHVRARDEGADDPNWKQVHELVSEASAAAASGDDDARAKAIGLYERALGLCTQTAPHSDRDQLDALCGLVDALDVEAQRAQPEARRQLAERLIRHARQALDLVPDDPDDIVPLTEEGAHQRQVIRRAGDALARHLAAIADAPPALEEALNLAECAAACVDGPPHHSVFDTQVRILLRLGRSAEAYRIVERVLAANPGFTAFVDIRDSDQYQLWRAGQV